MPPNRILLTVVVALGLLAGCADDGESIAAGGDQTDEIDRTDEIGEDRSDDDMTTDEGEPGSIDLATLTASTWVLRFGGGPDGEVPIVDGWPLTIAFDGDGTVGGTAACNGYGSAYELDGNALLLGGGMSVTDAGCAPEVEASQEAFLAALLDVDGINLVPGELALSGPATELIFGPTEPVSIDGLVGRSWLLEAVLLDDVQTAAGGEPAALLLDPDGSFTASTGCRDLVGRYVISGNQVFVDEMAAEGDCPADLFEQDSSVVTVLGDGFVPTIAADTLTLSSVGYEGLRYRASD